MGEHRMFALKIIDSDAFLDMSASAQNLYFHLAMRAGGRLIHIAFLFSKNCLRCDHE